MPVTTQTALFRAEEGIEQSSTNAGQYWIDDATQALKQILIKQPSFFCDEIWDHIERGNSPRAFGQVVRNAVKEGWIEEIHHKNGIVAKPSNSSNRQLKRIWKSNLYEGDQELPTLVDEVDRNWDEVDASFTYHEWLVVGVILWYIVIWFAMFVYIFLF